MKKNILYLSAALVLGMGMTSCIDNDEPAGVDAIRNAQAAKYNANAAKKNAEAAQSEAYVAYYAAQSAIEELNTKKKEIAVAKAELSLELAKANNQASIDSVKLVLANKEAAIEKAKITNETALVNAQKSLAQAEARLALAKEAALENEANLALAYAEYADSAVTASLEKVLTKESTYLTKVENLIYAQKAYAHAVYAAGLDSANNMASYEKEIASLESTLESKKYEVTVAEKALNVWLTASDKKADAELLGKIYSENDAKVTELNKQIDAITMKIKEAEVALGKANDAYNDEYAADPASAKLADLQKAIDAANDNITSLNKQKNALATERGYAVKLRNDAYSVSVYYDATLKNPDYVASTTAAYERGVETAKEAVAEAEATLQNKKNELATYKAGNLRLSSYSYGYYTYYEWWCKYSVDYAKVAVEEAQNAVDKAKADYEAAEAYYNAVVAAFAE